jgi:predicted O-methyltransferase YrrM
MSYVLSFRRKIPKLEIPYDFTNYEGSVYHDYSKRRWANVIPIADRPINYLEIGVSYGLHVITIADTYCKHPDSKIYCVDPWKDYDEYPEYKGQQDTIYNTFIQNINKYKNPSKFIINRGLSEDIVPTFDNEFFDIIFVDGNHETEYVYADGKMAFDKVKSEGYIIFDDYDWIQTKKGIDMFVDEYSSKLKLVSVNSLYQLILQKL